MSYNASKNQDDIVGARTRYHTSYFVAPVILRLIFHCTSNFFVNGDNAGHNESSPFQIAVYCLNLTAIRLYSSTNY